MSKLNIFIDGSWLFRACSPGKVLAHRTENPHRAVRIDFRKLNEALLAYAHSHDGSCSAIGVSYIATSIFSLPDDFDTWPIDHFTITAQDVERVQKSVFAREEFVKQALAAGYSADAVYRPSIKEWMIQKLAAGKFQEKQVDATVVALLVRSAIVNPGDYHVAITGDADILPAIRVAYPEYSRKVFMATTHPDELRQDHRQASFSIANFNFDIEPFYLQDRTEEWIDGAHVYRCAHCNHVFSRAIPIPTKARPCCVNCHKKREAQ